MSEINCQNCEAACCQGGIMNLTRKEANQLTRGGNNLKLIVQPKPHPQPNAPSPGRLEYDEADDRLHIGDVRPDHLSANVGRYVMIGACTFLEDTGEGWQRCSIYEERPKTCQTFEMGSDKCRLIRLAAGVDERNDVPVMLRQKYDI